MCTKVRVEARRPFIAVDDVDVPIANYGPKLGDAGGGGPIPKLPCGHERETLLLNVVNERPSYSEYRHLMPVLGMNCGEIDCVDLTAANVEIVGIDKNSQEC